MVTRRYEIIPPVAMSLFIENVMLWYEGSIYEMEHSIPKVKEDMIYYDAVAQFYLLDFLTDVHEYNFAMQHLNNDEPLDFPVIDYGWDKDGYMADYLWEHWEEDKENYEMKFRNDIRYVLDKNRMFYVLSCQEELIKYQNKPIVEVW